jgi:F0F1-type ATP synthase membrane subunit b/b'
MKSTIKEKINESIAFLENLNLQFQLGKNEMEDEFEKQKHSLKSWVNSAEEAMKESGKEQIDGIKASFEGLKVQLALGKAETKDELKEQQKNISKELHDLDVKLSSTYENSSDTVDEFYATAKHKMSHYKTQFELFKLQLHLGKKESEENWKDKKSKFSKTLHELKVKVDSQKEEGSKELKHFTAEISNAWDHFKKAFSDSETK